MSRKRTKPEAPLPLPLILIGQRLRAERERLGLSVADVALLVQRSEKVIEGWEDSLGSHNADSLTMLGRAGADVLYIVTGVRRDALRDDLPPEGAILHELGKLRGDERQRLLLHLCAMELRRGLPAL